MGQNLTLYAYFDTRHFLVRWEAAIGRMRSACDRNDGNFNVSVWFYNRMQGFASRGLTNVFIDEMKLEAVRQKYYPRQVSRLRGNYLFETEEQLEAALERWQINRDCLCVSPVNYSATVVTRVDSEWITNCLGNGHQDKAWMHSYWQGKPYENQPLTEVLCSGIGVVVDRDLRAAAYSSICEESPLTSKILSMSAAAFFCGHEEVGDCVPGLTREGDTIRGAYYIDMRAFKGELGIDFHSCLQKCHEAGAVFPYAPECDTSDVMELPKCTDTFEFKIDDQAVASLNAAVHGS